MRRYYKKFWSTEPMEEITEAVALASGRYALEQQAPRRFERWFDGALAAVYYPAPISIEAATRDSQVRYPGVDIEIHCPVEERENIRHYEVWHARDGVIENMLRTEEGTLSDTDHYRVYRYDAAGELLDYSEHVYDEEGLLEINVHAPDGTRITRIYED